MSQPNLDQSKVNFAAVTFAIQYYDIEKPICIKFERCRASPSIERTAAHQVILNWTKHFAVSRTFVGFGSLSLQERADAYIKIYEIITKCGSQSDTESSLERVYRVENALSEQLPIKPRNVSRQDSLARRSLLSATSKLLWLMDRSSIIFDNNVRQKLRTPEGNYEAYCEKWESSYLEMLPDINKAVHSWADSAHLFPTCWGLKQEVHEPWFARRVFDQYHWRKV